MEIQKEIIGTKNMNNFEILVGTGKAIIQSLHERFECNHQDDTEYIRHRYAVQNERR